MRRKFGIGFAFLFLFGTLVLVVRSQNGAFQSPQLSGGSGGSGCTTGSITSNVLPKSNGTGCVASSASDDGNTFSTSEPISSNSDGVHAGYMSIQGQTTAPTIPANSVAFIAPASASFTQYGLQFSATAPSTATPLLSCATPTSNLSACTWVAAAGGAGSLVQVPASTAANTVAPTANSVVSMTVQGSTGTGSPDIMDWLTSGGGTGVSVDSGGDLICHARCEMDQFLATGRQGTHEISFGAGTNTDMFGTVAVSASTTGTYTFGVGWNSAPVCSLTPQGDPTTVGVYWATTTTAVLTAHVKVSGTINFTYSCYGAPF